MQKMMKGIGFGPQEGQEEEEEGQEGRAHHPQGRSPRAVKRADTVPGLPDPDGFRLPASDPTSPLPKWQAIWPPGRPICRRFAGGVVALVRGWGEGPPLTVGPGGRATTKEREPTVVKLRLMRMGKKKQPTYRVVAADSRSPRNGRFIEILGTYQPRREPSTVRIDNVKAVDWLHKGAQPTERVRKLLEVSGAWDHFEAGTEPEPLEPAGPDDRPVERDASETTDAVTAS